MLRLLANIRDRHLMGTPRSFHGLVVYKLWTRPSFWSAQDNHGPCGSSHATGVASLGLDSTNVFDNRVKCGRHELMRGRRVVALHKVGFVSVTSEQVRQVLIAEPSEHG